MNALFAQIAGFSSTGKNLATDITKAKAAAFALSMFEVLDESEISGGISNATIGVLEQPTINDPSNVILETNTTLTGINTINTVTTIPALNRVV